MSSRKTVSDQSIIESVIISTLRDYPVGSNVHITLMAGFGYTKTYGFAHPMVFVDADREYTAKLISFGSERVGRLPATPTTDIEVDIKYATPDEEDPPEPSTKKRSRSK